MHGAETSVRIQSLVKEMPGKVTTFQRLYPSVSVNMLLKNETPLTSKFHRRKNSSPSVHSRLFNRHCQKSVTRRRKGQYPARHFVAAILLSVLHLHVPRNSEEVACVSPPRR